MKYFGNLEWSEENTNNTGLPRPYAVVPKDLQYKNENNQQVFFLHKKVPIPWQSIPKFSFGGLLNLNIKNEIFVIENEVCPYCGIKINNNQTCVRWTTNDSRPSKNGPRVQSDMMPFHIECMKQGRIFCPYMRTKENKDFEIGLFKDLIINARESIKQYPPID